jgi:hypothetical protein
MLIWSRFRLGSAVTWVQAFLFPSTAAATLTCSRPLQTEVSAR